MYEGLSKKPVGEIEQNTKKHLINPRESRDEDQNNKTTT